MKRLLIAGALSVALASPALAQSASQPIEHSPIEKALAVILFVSNPQCLIGTTLDAAWTTAGGKIVEDTSRPVYKACPILLGPPAPDQPQFPDPK